MNALLTPVWVGTHEVRNRVVFTAHGAFLDFYRPGIPAGRYVAYQERRARGGAGLIVLQAMHVHRTSHALGHYVYEENDLRPKLATMAEAVHRHGTTVVSQLIHFGAQFRSDARQDLEPLWAFDDVVTGEGEAAHRMSGAEIEEVLDGFARAAVVAVESGIDGVELHATHGYLVQQSFSPWGNSREDAWGEPLAFARALVARVRAAIGDQPIVGLRVSTDDFVSPARGGLGPERTRELVSELVAGGGLDYVNQSEGARTAHYARSIGTYRREPGEFLPLARALRERLDGAVPVIGVGKLHDPELAEQAIATGDCDLVAMTRAQIADPDLVAKLAGGGRVRMCVGANQGCVDRMVGGLPITCFHNPDVGREERDEPAPAEVARRVLVVGGGPAGLKAAEVAARRGHTVTLVEREDELGGRLRCVRRLGRAAELYRSIDWLRDELEELDVDVRLGREAGAEEIGAADVVVLATGSRPGLDRLDPGDGSVPLLSLDECVEGDPPTGRLLFVDVRGDLETALTAEHLAAAGAKLTLVTPALHVAPHVGFTHVKDILSRLYALGAELEPSTVLDQVEHGEAHTRHVHSGEVRRRPFDAIVAGVHGRSETALAASVEQAGIPLLLAGDAVAPRSALHAFREGADAGRAA